MQEAGKSVISHLASQISSLGEQKGSSYDFQFNATKLNEKDLAAAVSRNPEFAQHIKDTAGSVFSASRGPSSVFAGEDGVAYQYGDSGFGGNRSGRSGGGGEDGPLEPISVQVENWPPDDDAVHDVNGLAKYWRESHGRSRPVRHLARLHERSRCLWEGRVWWCTCLRCQKIPCC